MFDYSYPVNRKNDEMVRAMNRIIGKQSNLYNVDNFNDCGGCCQDCEELDDWELEYVEDFVPEKVIFNGRTRIVYFKDGSRSVVKCADGDHFSEEQGVANAIAKKVFGNNRSEFLRVVKSAYHQPIPEKKLKKAFQKVEENVAQTLPDPALVVVGTDHANFDVE